jgi:hypothetical protein
MEAKALVVQLEPEESAPVRTNTNASSNTSFSSPTTASLASFGDEDETDFPSFAAITPSSGKSATNPPLQAAGGSKPSTFLSVFDEEDDIFNAPSLLPAKPKPVEPSPAIATPSVLSATPISVSSPLAATTPKPTVTASADALTPITPAPHPVTGTPVTPVTASPTTSTTAPKKVFDFEDDIFNIPQLKPKAAVNASIDSIFPDSISALSPSTKSATATGVTGVSSLASPSASTPTATGSASTKKLFDFDDDIFKNIPTMKARDVSASVDSIFPSTSSSSSSNATPSATGLGLPGASTATAKKPFDFDDDIFNSGMSLCVFLFFLFSWDFVLVFMFHFFFLSRFGFSSILDYNSLVISSSKPKPKATWNTDDIFSQ